MPQPKRTQCRPDQPTTQHSWVYTQAAAGCTAASSQDGIIHNERRTSPAACAIFRHRRRPITIVYFAPTRRLEPTAPPCGFARNWNPSDAFHQLLQLLFQLTLPSGSVFFKGALRRITILDWCLCWWKRSSIVDIYADVENDRLIDCSLVSITNSLSNTQTIWFKSTGSKEDHNRNHMGPAIQSRPSTI